MPIVHIYSTEGWLSPEQKKTMIANVTDAIVAAEGVPEVREITAVIIHEVAEGGWSFRGKVYNTKDYKNRNRQQETQQ